MAVDKIFVYTSTIGTGSVTPGNTVAGFRNFSTIANNTNLNYELDDPPNWEIGTGLWNGTILTRTPTDSSNNGGLISLSGNAIIINVTAIPAAQTAPKYNYVWANMANNIQVVASANTTKVQLSSIVVDNDGVFDPTTNFRYTPTVNGNYLFVFNVRMEANTGSVSDGVGMIMKNGTIRVQGSEYFTPTPSATVVASHTSAIIPMNGQTDFVETFVFYQSNNSANGVINGNTGYTNFFAQRLPPP